jgi:hypothetical protein
MTRLAIAVALVLFPVDAGSQEASASVCEDSARLARLARIDASPDAAMVRTQSSVWCAAKEAAPALTWPNKQNARLPSGAWNYPNGRSAKTSGGVWKYAGGGTARSSSGVWSYPDGRTAKFESGRWQRPDGKSVTESELLSWACERLGEGRCRRSLNEIGALSGFDKELAMIDLAWSARATR